LLHLKENKTVKLPLHVPRTHEVESSIAPIIVNLGTRWRQVVSLTPRPLYVRDKSPQYLLNRRPHGRSGCLGENILPLLGDKLHTVHPLANSVTRSSEFIYCYIHGLRNVSLATSGSIAFLWKLDDLIQVDKTHMNKHCKDIPKIRFIVTSL